MSRTSVLSTVARLARSAWLAALLLVALCPSSARAWIETSVRGHHTVVTVSKDGSADVRQELVLKIRGGPVKSLEVAGIGSDIEPLEDGTVRRALNGSSSVWPLRVEPTEDGAVKLLIGADRGLRGGVYRFEFGYRIDARGQGWFEQAGERIRATWVGPRLDGGIDSAKVTFRVPRGSAAPSLPDAEEGPSAAVLLTEVRRGAQTDEVELVRAHVAQDERPVWQVEITSDALGTGVVTTAPAPEVGEVSGVALRALPTRRTPHSVWLLAALLGLAYGVSSSLKWRAARHNAERIGATPRSFLPLPPWLRHLIAGASLGGAVVLGLLESPTWAGFLLGLSMLAATLLPATRVPKPRGPGEWHLFEQGELVSQSVIGLRGRLLDAGSPLGFLLFVVLLGVIFGGAWGLLPQSSYQAGLAASSAAALLPLFLTGRIAELPPDTAQGALPLYCWLEKKLRSDSRVTTALWARRPLGGGQPDELRLRLRVEGALPGVRAIEIATELGAGLLLLPCVIVRVLDDSPAYRALPRSVVWTRGRDGEERVAILRPKAPHRGQCLRVVLGVLGVLAPTSAGGRSPGQPRANKSARSLGKGESTSNRGTSAVSHAT